MVTPCNMHIDILANEVTKGVNSNGKSVIFNTITVSDGISMGTRNEIFFNIKEVIADSIETVSGAGFLMD